MDATGERRVTKMGNGVLICSALSSIATMVAVAAKPLPVIQAVAAGIAVFAGLTSIIIVIRERGKGTPGH